MRYSLSLAAAISITLAACSKYEPVAIEEASFINDGYEVESVIFEAPVIKKGEDDPETRSTLIPNGESIRFAWEKTDTVGIYPDRGSQVFFSMEGWVGTNVANFEGGGWALRQSSTYTSYYPFIGDMYLDREKIPVSFLGQEQNGVSNYDNTRFILASEGTSSEQGTLRFSYEMLSTIIMVNATLPAGNYTKMSLIADEPVFMAEGFFSLKDRAITGSTYTKELVVTLNDIALAEESTIQFYLTEAPVDLRGKEITVRFYTADGKSYSCVKSPSKAYDAGTWYGLNCVVSEDEVECPTAADDLYTPLTLEAINDGSISIENPLGLTIEYFKNNTWNETDETQITIPVVAGEAISFRGNNEAYASLTRSTHFSTGNCYIYGNIMSLISSNDFTSISSVKERAFYGLFNYSYNITNHPQRELLLPATSLSKNCYSYMFTGSSLTRTPDLPATNLAEECYIDMFSNCGSLTSASELPAISLAARCYCYMFHGCKSLKIAPKLPATELAELCYEGMFSDCTSLTTAPELPATYLAEGCYDSMFNGCIKLEKAPVLPARFLRNGCYSYMFYDCMKLNHVEAHFLTKPGIDYTNNWLAGVSSNGSFVKNASWDVIGDSGVPEGWTIINNGEEVINVFFVDGVDFGQLGSYIDAGEFLSSYYSDISLQDVDDLVFDLDNFTIIRRGIEENLRDGMYTVFVAPDTPTKTLDGEVYFAVKDPVRPTRSVLIPKNERGYLMYFNNGRNMPEEFYLVVRAKLQYGSSYINLDPADIVVRTTEGQDIPPALVIETEPTEPTEPTTPVEGEGTEGNE